MAPGDRAALLRRFADVVDAHIEELAQLEVTGSGHPIGQARWEAGNVRDVLRYYSAAPERLFGQQIPVPGGLDITFKEPVGIVGLIVPWNFPMPILGWGLAPALAAGQPGDRQAGRADPADRDPDRRAGPRRRAARGRVPGAAGQGLGGRPAAGRAPGCAQDRLHRVHRGGQPADGRTAPAQVKRVTLELGGKSANIVFADADLEKAAATAPYAVFDNAGQDCCARSRILVQASVFDRFMELLEPAVKGVAVGDPADQAPRWAR